MKEEENDQSEKHVRILETYLKLFEMIREQ